MNSGLRKGGGIIKWRAKYEKDLPAVAKASARNQTWLTPGVDNSSWEANHEMNPDYSNSGDGHIVAGLRSNKRQ